MQDRAPRLTGLGHALPARVVTNDDLARTLDTSDEWIRSRSGIATRHHVDPGTATSDLAAEAGARALKADLHTGGTGEVDLVVLATTTPDRTCPATAPLVAHRLGLGTVPAFDVNAVCSGFLYGLSTASAMITAGAADSVLLVAADTFSTIVDPADRRTAFLFGDGAGAAVLRAGGARTGHAPTVHDIVLGSDGGQEDLIITPGGGSREPGSDERWFTMQGQAVYRQAVDRMTGSTREILDRTGWAVDEVDRFVGHQANRRILDAVAHRLGVPADRVVANLDRVGNTAAASIPVALSDAHDRGILRPGDKVVLTAFGGGATWGAATLTWPDLG
ncbi:beta-ketoacyl-ACP synthase III [Pseudonocardia halophobica]|uniref:Beta-ketoacyl-[acyl-carrier-protein] synthase III n=1 Tax=Pseudonocardia halophobica TaxID=29401 RepID=A0A9W6NVY9_9PSEU|nr:beta-ketoacyl-ACP synthase III [Pseudonocardia halophobica]GLL11830.1 3-oxoacyl-[acyl-carrier-protein] synthase 3 protein 5 [Pseudonocardia halophobica]